MDNPVTILFKNVLIVFQAEIIEETQEQYNILFLRENSQYMKKFSELKPTSEPTHFKIKSAKVLQDLHPSKCQQSSSNSPPPHSQQQNFSQAQQYISNQTQVKKQTLFNQSSTSWRQQQELTKKLSQSMKFLEQKMQKMELTYSKTQSAQEQILETCHNLRNQIVSRLNTHDEAFIQRTRHLAEIQKKWLKKSEQRVQQAEASMEKLTKELKSQVKKINEKLLKQEKDQTYFQSKIEGMIKKLRRNQKNQAEIVASYKFDQPMKEIQKQKLQTSEQMKILEETLIREIQIYADENRKSNKLLQERMIFRIKEESEAIEVVNNKISELMAKIEQKQIIERKKIEEEERKQQERKERQRVEIEKKEQKIKQKQKIEKEKREQRETRELQKIEMEKNKLREEMEKMQKKKDQQNEKLVNQRTPYAHMFAIQGNKITYQGINTHQILLDMVIPRKRKFVFNVQLIKGKFIKIGVVDKLTQEQAKISSTSGNSVCYDCADGKICNGSKTGIRMSQGMNVDVEVSLDLSIIYFYFFGGSKQCCLKQANKILAQQNREFVPFFEMCSRGDSIRWTIK